MGAASRGVVTALGSATAPRDHQVVLLELAEGRWVTASRGHPLADGRPIGALHVGDQIDGSRVIAAARITYGGGRTYDLAVSGQTGLYLAGGIPLMSTLTNASPPYRAPGTLPNTSAALRPPNPKDVDRTRS
jgi:hypothetical protein